MSIPRFDDNQGAAASITPANGADARSVFERSAEHRLARRKTPAGEPSPHNNMGVGVSQESLSVPPKDVVFSLDWLSLTIYTDFDWNIKPALDFLGLWDGLEDSGHGGTGFARLVFGKWGFQAYADPYQWANVPDGDGQKTKDYFSLRFPGQCVNALGVEKLMAFLNLLLQSGIKFKPSRLDLAFDTQLIKVSEVQEAWAAGEVACRGIDHETLLKTKRGEVVGHTEYFGDRQSPAFLRVYHKTDGHSFGDEPFTRFELECKEDRAVMMLHALFATPIEDWSVLAGGWLLGYFAIEAADGSALAAAWSRFTAGVQAAWTRLTHAPTSLAKMSKWLLRSVAPTLACVLMAQTGGDTSEMYEQFRALVASGADKMSKLKRALAADAGADIPDVLLWLKMDVVF